MARGRTTITINLEKIEGSYTGRVKDYGFMEVLLREPLADFHNPFESVEKAF